MKRILSLLVILWLCMGFVSAQEQINPMEFPKLTQQVSDFSTTLTTSQLDEVNVAAKNYEDETSNQLFVVLFPHRQGNELIDIGMKIFEDSEIWQKGKDNGLLLLISTEEKKIRIIVWYGLEWVYPDLIASQIIENDIRPLVNSDDFYDAVKIFYERSEQVIAWEYTVDKVAVWYWVLSDENLFWSIMFLFWIIGGALLQFITRLLSKKVRNISQRIFWILLLTSFLFMMVAGILFFIAETLSNSLIKMLFSLSFGLIIGLAIGGVILWLYKVTKWWWGSSSWWWGSSWWWSSSWGSSWGGWWWRSGWGWAGD